MQEVIDCLENIIRIINTQPSTISEGVIREQANQALAKLRAAPTELKLPVFMPDDYDTLYSVAQAMAKKVIAFQAQIEELESALDMAKIHNAVIKKNRNEFFDETVKLQAEIDKLVEGQEAKRRAGSGGKVNDGTIR